MFVMYNRPNGKPLPPSVCYNCWTNHSARIACKYPRKSLAENEELRVRLGVPLPDDPSYRAAVRKLRCTNCWQEGHRFNWCPEDKVTVYQSERRRVQVGAPMTEYWKGVLGGCGVKPLSKGEAEERWRGTAVEKPIGTGISGLPLRLDAQTFDPRISTPTAPLVDFPAKPQVESSRSDSVRNRNSQPHDLLGPDATTEPLLHPTLTPHRRVSEQISPKERADGDTHGGSRAIDGEESARPNESDEDLRRIVEGLRSKVERQGQLIEAVAEKIKSAPVVDNTAIIEAMNELSRRLSILKETIAEGTASCS